MRDINFFFLTLALIAEVMGTIGGFGSSVFFVPISNFFFAFQTVLGFTALFHLSSNISKITLFRKGLEKKLLIYIGVPSVVFVIVGGLLSKYLETFYLEVLLGIFLVSLSLLFLIRKQLEIKPEKKQSIIGGALSGFSAGLLGTGGAIRGVTMAAFNLEKSVFIATSAAIDLGIDFSRTVVYFYNGYIRADEFRYIPFLFLIGFVGTYLGKRILTRISQENFKTISLSLILIIGIASLIKSLIS